jgi:hypothetical protein
VPPSAAAPDRCALDAPERRAVPAAADVPASPRADTGGVGARLRRRARPARRGDAGVLVGGDRLAPGRVVARPPRVHLAPAADRHPARVQALGARVLWPGNGFVALEDPVGLPFCVTANDPDR